MKSFTIEKLVSGKTNRYLLSLPGGKCYYVGELIANIIDRLSAGQTPDTIANELNDSLGDQHHFSAAAVTEIIETKITPLNIFSASTTETKLTNTPVNDFTFSRTITRLPSIERLLHALRFLFKPVVFYTGFLLLLASNAWLFYDLFTHHRAAVSSLTATAGACGMDWYYFFIFYGAAIGILYLHEIGHAAAAYRFNVLPQTIGFGLYIIFPVLYTELNGVWRLQRRNRLIVNLGGIFMQLIINTLLFAIVFNTESLAVKKMCSFLIQLNVFTIIVNCNPFLKFDGYWILSDLFQKPNLASQSFYYISRVVQFIAPGSKWRLRPELEAIVNPRDPFLIIYSLLRYAFLVYIYIMILWGLVTTIGLVAKQSLLVFSGVDSSRCTIESLVKNSITAGIIIYFISRLFRNVFKRKKNSAT